MEWDRPEPSRSIRHQARKFWLNGSRPYLTAIARFILSHLRVARAPKNPWQRLSHTPTGTELPPFPYHGNQVPRSSTRASLFNPKYKVNMASRRLKHCACQDYSHVHHTIHQAILSTRTQPINRKWFCPQLFSNGVDKILWKWAHLTMSI